MRTWFLAGVSVLAITARAAPRTDFSGAYTLASIAGGPQSAVGVWRLDVRQDDDGLRIITIQDGAENQNVCPFGRVGPYHDRNRELGTCKAEWQKNDVVLKIFLRIPARPGQPPRETNVREVWHLSDDLKRLSIRTERDSNVFPPDPRGGLEPLVEVYRRD